MSNLICRDCQAGRCEDCDGGTFDSLGRAVMCDDYLAGHPQQRESGREFDPEGESADREAGRWYAGTRAGSDPDMSLTPWAWVTGGDDQ